MRRAALVVALLFAVGCGETRNDAPVAREGTGSDDAPVARSAGQLLGDITAAERAHAYSGYKTAYHGEDGGGRRTQMRVSRLADGRMILEWERDGRKARRWVVRHRHRWIDDPTLLLENYDVVPIPGAAEPIADRATFRVEIRPRHEGRPSLTLLVDRETDLVLAERLRDHDGVQRFAWSFDSLGYSPPELAIDEAEVVAAPDRTEIDPGRLDWPTLVIGSPPRGFVRVARLRGARRAGQDQEGVATRSFVEYWSDGLAAFSLHQSPADDVAGIAEGRLERRECSGRASVTGVVGGVEIALLGNIPIDELEAVAAGLRLRP